MSDKTPIQMTEENRPYIEALARMTLGIRDRDAEQVLLNVIEELVDRRRKTGLAVKLLLEVVREYREMKRDASAPLRALEALIGLDSAERQVWAMDQQLGEERRQKANES